MVGFAIIIAFAAGFVVAQVIKTVTMLLSCRKRLKPKEILRYSLKSGGMPSGHAASFSAATTLIGLHEGINSPIFALSLCILIVILYDAVNVRFAVGEQGKKLNLLLKERHPDKMVAIIEGHTLSQITVGVVLGISIGFVVFITCF